MVDIKKEQLERLEELKTMFNLLVLETEKDPQKAEDEINQLAKLFLSED